MPEGRTDLWYKTAVFYGQDVSTFQDSNGDGIGDFPGLCDRLEYVADLGVDLHLAAAVLFDSGRRQRL